MNKTSRHPLVNQFFVLLKERQVGVLEMSEGSGISSSTLYNWRHAHCPNLAKFEAALNVIGYKLQIVKNNQD